ncbi:Pls/PosA family non-ribosomal peptide synthetase [Acidocella sp.]|jgi:non-ribosomal peptide synthetase-like protein|uniref:Pls/PosA family non-ribosomal peptide synthetase n=1 Tax=Acidocella sp. TaxID=50710 RepID=UPI002F3F912A
MLTTEHPLAVPADRPRASGGAAGNVSPAGCLHELFEACVDEAGADIALVCGTRELSYATLEVAANRLAHHLRTFGIGPGGIVGICLERSEQPIIALLACLKAGAAYVPLDPTHPDERLRHILDQAGIAVLICEQATRARIQTVFHGTLVSLDDSAAEIAQRASTRLTRAETGVTPLDLCYVLYTSGTTGRPKGVMTEHRNAHHFVRAFNTVCPAASARVYQGFSLGFDGSVEEIWRAFSTGSTLVVGDKETPRFGNDLAHYLARAGVTYFSTVPTMLSTMTDDIPSLCQLVVSGEVCPPELVARWARPGRLMLNVYGPTEATVNTTAKACRPGEAVTIGQPLSGYIALILDADMNPLPPGERGELYIGGPGIARGYLNQPELTERHFITAPVYGRLYRTGDLAARNAAGEIEFFGRIDDQVKIRGFRVELSEITSVLLEQENIASATVTAHRQDGLPVLAAYVVAADPGRKVGRGDLLQALRAKLPSYMVPGYLDILDELPMLATGKVDRKRLPAPSQPLVDEGCELTPPENALEANIAGVWAETFNVKAVGTDQDFFLDLGGHSLRAAQMVAQLRGVDVHIAVRDVYAHPTVRKLAAYVPTAPASETKTPDAERPPLRRQAGPRVATLQSGLFVLSWYLFSTPLLLVLPVVNDLMWARLTILQTVEILLPFYIALTPVLMAVGICSKWLIIGRYRPGAYPLWGSYYIRWWLASRLQVLSGAGLFLGTPLMPVYYRLMGAKVGRGCVLDSALVSAWDLVSIGDDTSISADTQLYGARVEGGYLLIGGVDIGSRCFVGGHSALGLNVRMGDESRLAAQSLLPDGTQLEPGAQRRGSPGMAAEVPVPPGEISRPSLRRQIAFVPLAWLAGSLLGLVGALPALAVALFLLLAFRAHHLEAAIGITAALVPVLVVITCLWIVLLKAIVLRRAKPGVYPLYSFYYLRHWLAYGLMRASRAALLPVFTTLYLPPWMRLLGAKIGAHAEMSTIWSFMPELLVAGDSAFFADGCMFGGKRCFGGRFEIRTNHVGHRSFVGNGAILPTGSGLGDHCLLGVLSAPPTPGETTPDGTDWLGSPSFQLPNRQKVGGFSEEATYRPSRKLYAQRAIVDALRILIPAYTGFALALGLSIALLYSYDMDGLWISFLLMLPLGLLAAALAVVVVVGLKWTVMGRFKPVIVPLWSPYVWFNEMVNGAYESLMAPVVAMALGTPFAAPLLRLLGCKIGRHCYLATALFSEFDLVLIGDYVALNAGAVIQNHLFEDRIMKSSYLMIERGCSVGNMSVVLYDTRMEADARLGPMSLLMKGEIMPSGSRWHGIPTVRAG